MGNYNKEFKGIIVAMTSCYKENGEINTRAIKELTRFHINKGVSGLYIGGSSGEGFLHTINERKKILEAVVEECAGEISVIAQIGSIATKEGVELAKHADSLKVDAISAVPPFYYAVSEDAVENHWLNMIENSSIPFIIYNIPATTGYSISKELFSKMVSHEQVIGIKTTTASTYELQQFKAIGGSNFFVFNGPDEQYLAGRVMGADAGIGGTYGAMPELFIRIEKAFADGNIEEAQRWQFIVNEIITDMLKLPVHSAIKEIIKLRGIDCGSPRLPLEPISPSNQPHIKRLYKKIMGYVEKR